MTRAGATGLRMGPTDLLGLAPPRGRARFGAWQIELTSRCPLRCRMCIRQGDDPWRSRDLAVAEFARIAAGLGDAETVVLQGWGEPLLHGDLAEIVRIAKGAAATGRARRGGLPGEAPAVGFVTSGRGLDAARAAELVAAGLDFLGFSLAGATPATHAAIRVHSDLEEVVAAAAHVAAARRRGGRGTPRTHVVFLAVRDNVAELPAVPALAARMGCAEIVVTNLVQVVDAWQEAQQVFGREERRAYEAVLAETERRAAALGIAVRRAALAPAPAAVCEEDPLRNLYVGVNGDVSPCVYLAPPVAGDFTRRFGGRAHRVPRLSFGNALAQPVAAIWDAAPYAAFRERFARRARTQRLLAFVPASWRRRLAGGAGDALPEPPAPCRTCHKLLGA
ncbi:MAG TPA: radical SAM protein [Anaeromyxobacter sp.]|nr:radical SAM protein [Anaeromyxobacter sp.]